MKYTLRQVGKMIKRALFPILLVLMWPAVAMTDPEKELEDFNIVDMAMCQDRGEVGNCVLVNKDDKTYIIFHDGKEIVVVWRVQGVKPQYHANEMEQVYRKERPTKADKQGLNT